MTHLGHSMNQSMVQQFTKDGNMRHRVRNASPTGLIHNTICRLFLTWLMKYANTPSRSFSAIPASFAAGRVPASTFSNSSGSKRFGTCGINNHYGQNKHKGVNKENSGFVTQQVHSPLPLKIHCFWITSGDKSFFYEMCYHSNNSLTWAKVLNTKAKAFDKVPSNGVASDKIDKFI